MHTETEVHTGTSQDDKGSLLVDLPCADRGTCVCLHSKAGAESGRGGQESRDHVGRRGNRDSELMPRSQGHYLRIRVLSLFSPENKVLK